MIWAVLGFLWGANAMFLFLYAMSPEVRGWTNTGLHQLVCRDGRKTIDERRMEKR